jgi:hypothetical protein
MPTFPNYGKLLLPGYGEDPESAVDRTQMESGPPKQAMVRSRVMVSRPVVMLFTASEYASFKTWFRTDVARGADWFDWTDPADGATRQARIVDGRYRANAFAESPGAPLSWEVAMVIETWDA